MNINELNRIKVINIDEALKDVERGTGTFKEIIENVMSNTIIPITAMDGTIVGFSYSKPVNNLIEDNIEKCKFERRYSGKPIMEWVKKSLKLKAEGKVVVEVTESETGIQVTLEGGEVVDIETYTRPQTNSAATSSELPDELEIPMDEIEDSEDAMKGIKKYLRSTYGHYLSGLYGDPEVEEDEDEEGNEIYRVTGIHWGRKI